MQHRRTHFRILIGVRDFMIMIPRPVSKQLSDGVLPNCPWVFER
jgi:hypothetical protein